VSEVERDRARRLPPGPHGIPPELVARNQRERLVAAMAEVCAERGYGATTVAELTRRAGVSTASFYRQFKDRRECMLASFEELSARLADEAERACAGEEEPGARVRAAVAAVAGALSADPPAARLLSVEVLAVGPEGVRLQQGAIDRLAERLRAARGGERASPLVGSPEWAAVAATVSLVARRAAAGEALGPAELEAILRRF